MQGIELLKAIKIDNPRLKYGIDRDEENRDVIDYVKTGDQLLFEKIYKRRKPTIEYLAKKYHWLTEDAASEIRIVLVRTVNSYGSNGKKTDFNTFFYSSIKNHFSNIAKKRYRKKRTTIDGIDPLNRMVPLDSCIGDDESSSMHEFIANEDESVIDSMDYKALLSEISRGNSYISEVLSKIHDMTRREISKDKELIFNFLFPLISGDILTDISSAIGLPSDSYVVSESVIENGRIRSKIRINGRKLIGYISKSFLENKVVVAKIKGFRL